MDRISQLHDELLLRILSLLPTTKDVMPTMFLSKRWQFLWTLMPTLVYDDSCNEDDEDRRVFTQFVDRSLFLHEAPIIETLHFELGEFRIIGGNTVDIQVWIRAVEKRRVSNLIIELEKTYSPITLPRNLYTCFRKLVTLKLSNTILLDGPVSFPSLRKLSLVSMRYPGVEFLERLFSGSPLIEDLEVKQCGDDKLTIFCVRMFHLKKLVLHTTETKVKKNDDCGVIIEAPSLESLNLVDSIDGFCLIENPMLKIVEANIVSTRPCTEQLLDSLNSAKRLYLCLSTSNAAYPVEIVFQHLVHLKICTCEKEWLNLLMRLLTDSPKLQSLKLEQCHNEDEQRPCWSEPVTVPECLISSLETFEWVSYEGAEEEKEVALFILRSGCCLKKVTIKPKSCKKAKKLRMIKELTLSPRRSPTCRLSFD